MVECMSVVVNVMLSLMSVSLFVCLFVGLFHVGNWNFWLFKA